MSEPVIPTTDAGQPAEAPNYVPMAPASTGKPKSGGAFGGKRILIWIGVVVVILIGSYVYKHVSGDPDVAKVGSCMTGQSKDTLKVVGCDDAKVQWKVIGKVDDQKDPKTDEGYASACSKWTDTGAAFWKGSDGSNGYVLCLVARHQVRPEHVQTGGRDHLDRGPRSSHNQVKRRSY